MARFLVVDGTHSTVNAMSRLLRDDGHEVIGFTVGADAVDALSREHVDAVVTDLEVPHVDGHEVVRAAREHRPEACLVVSTARANQTVDTLVRAGACIVAEPLDYAEVTRAGASHVGCALHRFVTRGWPSSCTACLPAVVFRFPGCGATSGTVDAARQA